MLKLSVRVAYPIIIAGLFVIVAFMALNYDNLNMTFYVIFFMLVVYIFLFGFATGQSFAKPVQTLLERADNLSKGDLKSRFYPKNQDEIGRLAEIFNKIAEELEQSKNETQTAEKSVDIKVKARTQAFEETINALEQKVKNRTFELERIAGELEKFRGQSSLKETEVAGLKKELDELKQDMGGIKKPKNQIAKKTKKEPIATAVPEPKEPEQII
jgi:methyl-accepting chemotaxis protein